MNLHAFIGFLSDFVFLFPLIMSLLWTVGAVIFYVRRERRHMSPPELREYPLFSVVVPCHNEQGQIENSISCLMELDYPEYEVIVVDDGSTDQTPELLKGLCERHERLRVIYLTSNQGKAMALNCGCLASKGEFVLSVDADALVEKDALRWIAWHFVNFPRVGAVTGNPRVLNRTTLLAKIQTGEFATIIGLIKRTQRLLGKVLTVSGVMAAFRKRALLSVGFWDSDMVTEDIDVTWKLEKSFWDIRYEPRALCWVLVPETIRGLWRQRVRWAQGGVEVLKKHRDIWKDWRQRRLWPVYLEYTVSVIWAYSLTVLVILSFGQQFGLFKDIMALPPLIPPRWTGALLAAACLVQFAVSLVIERHYEQKIFKYYFWVIWYPLCYWLISALTVVYAAPRALLKRSGTRAVWKSPDRGLDVSGT